MQGGYNRQNTIPDTKKTKTLENPHVGPISPVRQKCGITSTRTSPVTKVSAGESRPVAAPKPRSPKGPPTALRALRPWRPPLGQRVNVANNRLSSDPCSLLTGPDLSTYAKRRTTARAKRRKAGTPSYPTRRPVLRIATQTTRK